ncbi:MAG: DUF115 domain-containing protein [Anaerolineae bacterium]|nr:DUF115 domain-containing protein [Anaerolineae bacterium]
MRESLKRYTPEPLWRMARSSWLAVQHARQWPLAALHPWRLASKRNLRALKNIHQGERCFIIGNGPSLKLTDVSKLRGEFTFGMNRIYPAFKDWGFETSYFVSINDLVIEQCAEDIRELPVPKFLSWRARKYLTPTADTTFLHTTYTGPKFSTDARGRMWEGATVTYIAMQLAFHMGFEKVILIGVDHSFTSKGAPNTTVVSQGDDPNHFDANYFGKGFRWQLPDLDTSEIGYIMARQAYQNAGREILDATIGGKLTVFPKVEYESLF